MTNLGILTTPFIPAPNCTSIISGIIYTQTVTNSDTTTTTTYKYHSLGPDNTITCYPPSFRVGSDIFYSPGVCPSGRTSACGSIEVIGTVTETRATCCPLGYTCQGPPPVTATWSTLSCITSAISTLNITVPDDAHQQFTVVQLQPIINVAAVNVRWQQSDIAAVTTSSTISDHNSSPSPSPSPSSPALSLISSPTASPSPPPTSTPPSDGISNSGKPEIKAGVGVAIGLGALVFIGSVIFCFWYVRRRRKQQASEKLRREAPHDDNAPTSGDANNSPSEIWTQYQPELPTVHNTHEMTTAANTHELQNPATRESFAHRPTIWSKTKTHARNDMGGSGHDRGAAELP
ncbi:hypothetical protein F4777DRAFT_507732 [Nemania sp. FL0916]|nr:hypothetical protein F4777DRAFT_507732 [Nemania sp. FL0916]